MPEDQLPDAGASRARLVTIALRLVMVSVAFGTLTGAMTWTRFSDPQDHDQIEKTNSYEP